MRNVLRSGDSLWKIALFAEYRPSGVMIFILNYRPRFDGGQGWN
jgi:hypothetical protein